MSDKEKIKDIEDFLKKAFCIDGECKFKGFDVLISDDGQNKKASTFKLTDSEKGDFHVSLTQ